MATSPPQDPNPSSVCAASTHRLREVILPSALLMGDLVCAGGGLVAGYMMRFHTPIADLGIRVPDATLPRYLPILQLGIVLLVVTFAYLRLYDPRLLLRRDYSLNLILKGMAFWLAAYLGLSLAIKFDPPISRLLALVAFGTTLLFLYVWRTGFYALLTRTRLLERVKRRVLILGCETRALEFAIEVAGSAAHPFQIAGFVSLPGEDPERAGIPRARHLGPFDQISAVLERHQIDIVVTATLDIPRDVLAATMEACERRYVEWKIIPSAFELFVSNLQLESYGGIPILGVGQLAIRSLFNRAMKRAIDIAGALVGLAVGLPLMLAGALLVRRESPGPVLFRQTRIGANHRPFTMLKLRTMRVGAEREDNARQSTTVDDPRVLRIGRILRRWNIDEMPQFWNVLCGDMSLVGPRPERPYHVDSLSRKIAHYLPRHLVKPGMTGWAQVRGCRGDSDLERRLQLDIHYIENWSLLFDLQIMLFTLLHWRAPE
ncbi:MAG: sugar transferase [Opitutaceae bacterium]|nr:sugar transferase [Opitutaceae bacterium]